MNPCPKFPNTDSSGSSKGLSTGERRQSSSFIAPKKETGLHSYHRRAFAHNYFAPFIYHVILKKQKSFERFGEVNGDARIEFGNPGCAYIQESEVGKIIAKALIHLPYQFPILKLHQFCVMPDHVHILLEVTDWSTHHLDFYIDSLRESIAGKYSNFLRTPIPDEKIFEKGYCDKPLLRGISLNGWYNYIRLNPHRLAMRRQYPEFFQRVRRLKIGEQEYEAYGNLFLFRNPDKEAVKISRKFTPEEKAKKKADWLSEASQGTVLVSPFIHKEEKAIRVEAETLGASIILITHEAFPERFKPSAHDFALCSSGRLLIISLGLPAKTDLTRNICQRMNALAEEIAKL